MLYEFDCVFQELHGLLLSVPGIASEYHHLINCPLFHPLTAPTSTAPASARNSACAIMSSKNLIAITCNKKNYSVSGAFSTVAFLTFSSLLPHATTMCVVQWGEIIMNEKEEWNFPLHKLHLHYLGWWYKTAVLHTGTHFISCHDIEICSPLSMCQPQACQPDLLKAIIIMNDKDQFPISWSYSASLFECWSLFSETLFNFIIQRKFGVCRLNSFSDHLCFSYSLNKCNMIIMTSL